MSAIVHIVTALERGGAQRVALETATRLHSAERSHWLVAGGPAALSTEAGDRLGPRLCTLPALCRPIHPVRDLQALWEIRNCLRDIQRREGGRLVVHTHGSKAGVVGRLAARSVSGSLVVHTVHGFGFEAVEPPLRSVARAAERLAGTATDAMVFVSEADRSRANRWRLAPRARFRTIRAGIDPTPFAALRADLDLRDRARDQWGVPRDAPLIVTVANCKPQKDPLFHIDVLRELTDDLPNAHLLFVGGGPLLAAACRHAECLGIAGRVILPGFLDDPLPAYAAADGFLLASRWEGLPMSVLEALATGLAVVGRDCGWAADLAWARTLRAIPRQASARVFAEALREVLANSARSSRAEAASLPHEFTLDVMLKQLEELYDELLSGCRADTPPRRPADSPARPEYSVS